MRSALLALGLTVVMSGATVAVATVAGAAAAGDAVVASAAVRESGTSWRFDVTVRHPDTGWDHYADKWDVLAPDGTLLGTRVLLRPHVNEQPFTRSLGGIAVPAGLDRVIIRAHDNVDGYGQRDYVLMLPRAGG